MSSKIASCEGGGFGYHFLVLSDHNILSRGEKWMRIDSVEKRRRTLGVPTMKKYLRSSIVIVSGIFRFCVKTSTTIILFICFTTAIPLHVFPSSNNSSVAVAFYRSIITRYGFCNTNLRACSRAAWSLV